MKGLNLGRVEKEVQR